MYGEIPQITTAISDLETEAIRYDANGLMIVPSIIHIMVIKDFERNINYIFGPPGYPSLEEGVEVLRKARYVVFHNGIGFDYKVLQKCFGFEERDGDHLFDSLVCCQLFHSNVKEEIDFQLFEAHKKRPPSPFKFTGDLIGKHSLEAWGLRLKNPLPKGTYAEDMEAKGIDPWASFNPFMLEYAVQDVEVLAAVWAEKLRPQFHNDANKNAIAIEHYMARLMEQVREEGIYLDREWTESLVTTLEARAAEVEAELRKDFPPRYEPVKWEYLPIALGMPEIAPHEREAFEDALHSNDPDKIEWRSAILNTRRLQRLTPLMYKFKDNKIYRPYFNLPEGYVREMWGQVTNPKVNRKVKDKETGEVLYEVQKDVPFTKIAMTEFNPNSRPQVIRRLLEFGWQPSEFTDAGNPETNEVELAKIEEDFPSAKNIAKYLLIQKRLGQIKTGDKAWLNLVGEDGKLHPTIRACNTVAFRASHADPNISQVPSVKMKDLLDEFGKRVEKEQPRYVYYREDGVWKKREDGTEKKVKQIALKGEEGKWGWDCRRCFTVKPGWVMVGSDLAGIEMRAWAHYLWKYDKGYFADIVLNKDVHEENRVILGFANRRDAKSWLYAAMYGAGDEKLGSVIEPTASSEKQKQLGGASRARFMHGMKGLAELDEKMVEGVKRGWMPGLDGRKVPVRKKHAVLNALLQSAGAIISKYWIYFTMQIIEDKHGLKWGWDNDFTLLLYSHDELQFACKPEHKEIIKQACVDGALKAGRHLEFNLDVEVGLAEGTSWADTH